MIDWGTILSNKTKVKAVRKFAHSEGTGRELTSSFANTDGSGENCRFDLGRFLTNAGQKLHNLTEERAQLVRLPIGVTS